MVRRDANVNVYPRPNAPRFVIREGDKVVSIDGAPISKKRQFILEYLRQKGREGAFVMEMYRAWQQLCRAINKNPGSYDYFRTSVHSAKVDELIESFKEVPSGHGHPYVFYRLKEY